MHAGRIGRHYAGILAAATVLMLALGAPTSAGASFAPRLKPPAPAPAYATRADLERLREVRAALERRNWAQARTVAARVEDPTARSLAQWFYFYAEDPDVSLSETKAFLDAHPDWPALSKIQMHAEQRRLSDSTPAEIVLDFFNRRDPLTGDGKLQLARALIAHGDREAGELRIRDAWVNHDFTVASEQRILSRYGGFLTAEDHASRVDRMLWARQVTNARRTFPRLTARDRRMAEARAALLLAASNGPTLYNALPADERADPGVQLAAVRYYRRAGEEPRAVAIAAQAPTSPEALRNPSRWWSETQLLMRWALTEKRYADAYAMAAGHGLEPGGDFAEAEFNAGWIALRYLGEPRRAETHFAALAATVGAPISLARAWYWLGRAKEAQGDVEAAKAWYAQASEHIYTYYGQLAAERIGAPATEKTFDPPREATPAEKARFSSRPAVAALRILSDLKEDHPFLIFAYHVDDELESAGEYVELAKLAARLDATHVIVRAGKVGIGRGAFAAHVAYPLVFIPDEAAAYTPPEIILGISRQESEFNPRAYSRAGARGLMQLIPSTAQITARKERMRYSGPSALYDPHYNMMLGSAHLSHLFERFNGSRVMTFAAYNAGAARVDQWVGRYGDPRTDDVDPIDWVEQIPFAETRNYVQRVLENAQVYRSRLSAAPIAGRLAADLEVGGKSGRAGALPGAKLSADLPPVPTRIIRIAQNAAAPRPVPASAAAAAPEAESAPASSAGAAPLNDDSPASESGETILRQDNLPATESGANAPLRRAPTAVEPVADIVAGRAAAEEAGPATVAGEPSPSPAPIARPAVVTEPAAVAPASGAHAAAIASRAAIMPETAPEACETYRRYIAETDKEEARADDLNAGMLAELQSGGPNC